MTVSPMAKGGVHLRAPRRPECPELPRAGRPEHRRSFRGGRARGVHGGRQHQQRCVAWGVRHGEVAGNRAECERMGVRLRLGAGARLAV